METQQEKFVYSNQALKELIKVYNEKGKLKAENKSDEALADVHRDKPFVNYLARQLKELGSGMSNVSTRSAAKLDSNLIARYKSCQILHDFLADPSKYDQQAVDKHTRRLIEFYASGDQVLIDGLLIQAGQGLLIMLNDELQSKIELNNGGIFIAILKRGGYSFEQEKAEKSAAYYVDLKFEILAIRDIKTGDIYIASKTENNKAIKINEVYLSEISNESEVTHIDLPPLLIAEARVYFANQAGNFRFVVGHKSFCQINLNATELIRFKEEVSSKNNGFLLNDLMVQEKNVSNLIFMAKNIALLFKKCMVTTNFCFSAVYGFDKLGMSKKASLLEKFIRKKAPDYKFSDKDMCSDLTMVMLHHKLDMDSQDEEIIKPLMWELGRFKIKARVIIDKLGTIEFKTTAHMERDLSKALIFILAIYYQALRNVLYLKDRFINSPNTSGKNPRRDHRKSLAPNPGTPTMTHKIGQFSFNVAKSSVQTKKTQLKEAKNTIASKLSTADAKAKIHDFFELKTVSEQLIERCCDLVSIMTKIKERDHNFFTKPIYDELYKTLPDYLTILQSLYNKIFYSTQEEVEEPNELSAASLKNK